jgi:hypothetical protein
LRIQTQMINIQLIYHVIGVSHVIFQCYRISPELPQCFICGRLCIPYLFFEGVNLLFYFMKLNDPFLLKESSLKLPYELFQL